MDVRGPAVAGGFYPGSESGVRGKLSELFAHWDIDLGGLRKRKRVDCRGVVVPHAGWDYSGYVAARVFADIPKVERVVITGPNHYGMGPDFSVSSDDAWETPLGAVEVDRGLAERIVENSPAQPDEMAHLREHSIEVQLPFLQAVLDDFKIVPVSIKHYAPDEGFLEGCRALGEALAKALPKKSLVVASTDFTHYEPQEAAEEKDGKAMDEIKKLDEEGLFRVISSNRITMCGYGGVAAAIVACKGMGAKRAEEVAYMTSGDTTGDTAQVVGYGGLRIL